MAHTAAVAATCTSTGNIEYGQCTVCNKYFSAELLSFPTTLYFWLRCLLLTKWHAQKSSNAQRNAMQTGQYPSFMNTLLAQNVIKCNSFCTNSILEDMYRGFHSNGTEYKRIKICNLSFRALDFFLWKCYNPSGEMRRMLWELLCVMTKSNMPKHF